MTMRIGDTPAITHFSDVKKKATASSRRRSRNQKPYKSNNISTNRSTYLISPPSRP